METNKLTQGMGAGLALLALAAGGASAQVTLTGRVMTLTGQPIAGATVQFKGLANKATTDAEGRYMFNGPLALRPAEGYRLSAGSRGRGLSLRLERPARVSVAVLALDGRTLLSLPKRQLAAGEHAFDLAALGASPQLSLVRVRVDGATAWHKLTRQGGLLSLAGDARSARALAKGAALPPDSLYVTHPQFHGGLGRINGRTVTAFDGTQDLRMVSGDKGWDVCAPPYTINFDQSAGALYYQKLIADPVATNTQVLREVCQSIWIKPEDIPTKFRFKSYSADINTSVTTGVAATGGNKLFFNVGYINQQKSRGDAAAWYEVVGVLVHEAVHSYQPYYSTAGASGFGEAVPDAIRALTGFFRWPRGNRCSGSYTDAYQTGGKYWYFIEQKHPGFINKIYGLTSGDISARVQQVTGTALSAHVSECQTKGMP